MSRQRRARRICPDCRQIINAPAHLCQGRDDNPGGLRFLDTAPLMLLAAEEVQGWRK